MMFSMCMFLIYVYYGNTGCEEFSRVNFEMVWNKQKLAFFSKKFLFRLTYRRYSQPQVSNERASMLNSIHTVKRASSFNRDLKVFKKSQ